MAYIERALPLNGGGLNFKIVGGTNYPKPLGKNLLTAETTVLVSDGLSNYSGLPAFYSVNKSETCTSVNFSTNIGNNFHLLFTDSIHIVSGNTYAFKINIDNFYGTFYGSDYLSHINVRISEYTNDLTYVKTIKEGQTGSTIVFNCPELSAENNKFLFEIIISPTIPIAETDTTRNNVGLCIYYMLSEGNVIEDYEPYTWKENTIWVNTDTALGDCQFSGNEPIARTDGTILQEGDIWLKTFMPSNIVFNAVRKNALMIHLNTTKQYIGGVWTDVSFKIYQYGRWVEAATYVYTYNKGDLCTDTTGGWSTAVYDVEYWHTSNISFKKDVQSLNIGITIDDDNCCGSFYTANKIDLTNYSKLCVLATVNASSTSYKPFIFGAYSDKPTTSSRGTSVASVSSSTVNYKVLELDISNITDSQYIVLQVYKYSGWGNTAQSARIYQVWLE